MHLPLLRIDQHLSRLQEWAVPTMWRAAAGAFPRPRPRHHCRSAAAAWVAEPAVAAAAGNQRRLRRRRQRQRPEERTLRPPPNAQPQRWYPRPWRTTAASEVQLGLTSVRRGSSSCANGINARSKSEVAGQRGPLRSHERWCEWFCPEWWDLALHLSLQNLHFHSRGTMPFYEKSLTWTRNNESSLPYSFSGEDMWQGIGGGVSGSGGGGPTSPSSLVHLRRRALEHSVSVFR